MSPRKISMPEEIQRHVRRKLRNDCGHRLLLLRMRPACHQCLRRVDQPGSVKRSGTIFRFAPRSLERLGKVGTHFSPIVCR
ncbi:hypothetical protein JTE90_012517 [Oedothorax gibbosus]|uniref:Uncharacterized protein n=1 Tax=Oedothorax gibbosus TaxID=931172 RepID=A0AAV6UYH0_9ARAC|nr:hypothetical protein JTE90_012517 [Oedothorax gibbosus]